MRKKYLGILLLLFIVTGVKAQQGEEMLLPLTANPVLQQAAKQTQHQGFIRKSGVTDTLLLPFFDDFSKGEVFPNANRWADKNAYINTDFPIAPPSIGVATLDALDSTGRPYFNILAGVRGPCDTLSSQSIDISPYSVGNNIYLSFFFQTQGLSYFPIQANDSLVLQFKDNNGFWYPVWFAKGTKAGAFTPAIIKVDSAKYFHAGFQFRFINYQEYLGGVGQWHIDYVYMERNRNDTDVVFNDVAIAHKPASILREYQEMPYEQYKGFENAENLATPKGYLSNIFNVGRTVDVFNREVRDNANNLIVNSPRSGLALAAQTQEGFDFPSTLNTVALSSDTVTYNIAEYLRITGANFKRENDSVNRKLTFANWYAYDDGTAETGYGIRRGKGKVAYRFRVNKPDSLRAISIYFFQAEDTVKKPIILSVWNSITPNGFNEDLAYKKVIGYPTYTDSINGYHTYALDSAIAVTDSFFIGWEQTTEFFLNVGWDRNYMLDGDSVPNPALYFNTTGKWYQSFIPGTMMMRPHLGKNFLDTITLGARQPLKAEKSSFGVYPNPTNSKLWLQWEQEGEYPISISDITGKTLLQTTYTAQQEQAIDISHLSNGLYFIILHHPTQGNYTTKFIKY